MGSKKKTAAAAGGGGGAGWTKAQEEIFFAELATVCNISAALRAAGVGGDTRDIYKKKSCPEFRLKWDRAIGESYALLELEMLERARHGDDRPPPATPAEARQREIPTRIALQLLRQHQNLAKGRSPSFQRPMRGHKLRDELEKRLAEIHRRLGGAG
ncbi:MAG TPA: hypothetical protein VGX37_07715 [Allosphingosinicella sp.]|jgi:hypothetical protein|nr:hypothetical protein [Allosphingosinicella sp.]